MNDIMKSLYGDRDMIKVFHGEHSIHGPAQMVLQEAGRLPNGKYGTLVMALIQTDEPIRSQEAIDNSLTHELILGECIICPHEKFATNRFRGYGAAGLITSEAMFPSGYDYQTFPKFQSISSKDFEGQPRPIKL